MNDLLSRSSHVCSIVLLLLNAALPAYAQVDPASPTQTVFVFVQRTGGAANFGSRHLFEHVVNDLQEYLKEKKIASVIRTDDFSSGVALPLSAVQEMARNANATYLLYVIVDRPLTLQVLGDVRVGEVVVIANKAAAFGRIETATKR